jgi:integrase
MRGHIRRRGESSWELKFDIGIDPLTRKRATKYQSFKGTKREAQSELVRLLDSARRGDYVDPSKTTLGDFLARWERDWATLNVGPKTLERYKELLSAHVRPYLAALPIQKLQPVHLAELYAKLLREGRRTRAGADVRVTAAGLSPRTVGHVHRVLHKALRIAVEWGVAPRNPASVAKPPKVPDTEIEILSEEQARQILQRLRGRSLYMVALLGLTTGMRRGELLALRWSDVDLDGGKLRVEQSLEQTKLGGLRFKAPKTKHGRRTIGLPASVVTELRAHWKRQQEQRLRLGVGKTPKDGLALPSWDGSPRSPNSTTKEWSRALAELRLPKVSLHALRHTHASQLIASGMDVLTISRRLGHSSPTITLGVYGHLFNNSDDRAVQVMEAAFGKALTE